jgi:hypothetical protein
MARIVPLATGDGDIRKGVTSPLCGGTSGVLDRSRGTLTSQQFRICIYINIYISIREL